MERQSVLIVVKELIAGNRISNTAALLLAQLCDHRNKRTGQCNPKRKTLALELNKSVATITRALKELRDAGLISSKRGRCTNSYEIQMAQNEPSGAAEKAQNEPSRWIKNEPSGQFYPLYEPIQVEPERPRAEARSRRPSPQAKNPPNTAVAVVAKKEAGKETNIDGGGPIDLYYSAVLGSLRSRGRLLTANESRQVGNLMMLRQIERLKREGKVS